MNKKYVAKSIHYKTLALEDADQNYVHAWIWLNRYALVSNVSLLYSTVVLYKNIIKVRDFGPKLSPQNHLDIYILSDCLWVLVRHNQVWKCLQINPKPFH